jgi:hypothetical protein
MLHILSSSVSDFYSNLRTEDPFHKCGETHENKNDSIISEK